MPMLIYRRKFGEKYYNRVFLEGFKIAEVDSTTPLYIQSPPSIGNNDVALCN